MATNIFDLGSFSRLFALFILSSVVLASSTCMIQRSSIRWRREVGELTCPSP
jgi:hypothetical protein